MHEPAGRSQNQIAELHDAFRLFTDATASLEREYQLLRAQALELRGQLAEKQRALMASLERQRHLELQALRQSRLAAMGEMAAMLAHEVRNPLGAMELFTGLLLQDLRDRPETQRLAHQVARGIADLSHLVTNLLGFTRAREAGPEPIDCVAVVEDVLRFTVELTAGPGVAVERDYAAPTVPALADAALLRPALLNLVRNAVQAMPDGGRLRVAVAPVADEVRIAVTDSGPGVADADRETIFRPFYTTRPKGTGLGLSVARDMVEAMAGRLGVESRPGEGATFAVWLPGARRSG